MAARAISMRAFDDITIFRHLLSDCLEQGERVECDDGYWGEAPEQCVVPKHAWSRGGNKAEISQRVRARHETVNKRMKDFACLDVFFRHSIDLHSLCFRSVAVLTQLSFENGQPLFNAEYK